jgi:hypothetical protein
VRTASNPVSRRVNTVMGGFMPRRHRSVQDPSSVLVVIATKTDERSARRGAAPSARNSLTSQASWLTAFKILRRFGPL